MKVLIYLTMNKSKLTEADPYHTDKDDIAFTILDTMLSIDNNLTDRSIEVKEGFLSAIKKCSVHIIDPIEVE